MIPQNELSKEFNRQLKEKVSWLRTKLSQAVFTYVDVYSAKYSVINDAKNLGNFYCFSKHGQMFFFVPHRIIQANTLEFICF